MNIFLDLKYSGNIFTCHNDFIKCYYTVKYLYNSVMNIFLDLKYTGNFSLVIKISLCGYHWRLPPREAAKVCLSSLYLIWGLFCETDEMILCFHVKKEIKGGKVYSASTAIWTPISLFFPRTLAQTTQHNAKTLLGLSGLKTRVTSLVP